VLQNDSIAALSQQLAFRLMLGFALISLTFPRYASFAYCTPRSLWMIRPAFGFLVAYRHGEGFERQRGVDFAAHRPADLFAAVFVLDAA